MEQNEHEEATRLLTVNEVADVLRISVRAVFQHIAEGNIPRLKFGHRTTRILRSDLEKFIDDRRTPGQRRGW